MCKIMISLHISLMASTTYNAEQHIICDSTAKPGTLVQK